MTHGDLGCVGLGSASMHSKLRYFNPAPLQPLCLSAGSKVEVIDQITRFDFNV